MANHRIELEGSVGRFVSRFRADELVGSGRARMTERGTLALRPGAPRVEELAPPRTFWTECCRGFEMNGKAINRGMPWE